LKPFDVKVSDNTDNKTVPIAAAKLLKLTLPLSKALKGTWLGFLASVSTVT
jgi:hypothetical protein